MRHDKEMFLSSCGCCSRGLTDLLSHCHWMGSRRNEWPNLCQGYRQEEGVQGWKRLRMGVEQEGGGTGGGSSAIWPIEMPSALSVRDRSQQFA